MAELVLGTAGHIDHGKTALVKALTGTDTDRLAEEQARGITIELGFAELAREGGPSFGVVDVPGHEAFVRAMVAGAAGMDVVLLVVAADEGVMPQTREHLAIVELLGVTQLVVALTKVDLVEVDWIELVEADIAETLAATPYGDAPVVRTSAVREEGLEELLDALAEAGERVRPESVDDLCRLPLDRVFTIQGTGTVVTGTLWSGRLGVGDRVRLLPEGVEARVRSLQVHGRDAHEARAGARTAVALTGADRDAVARGSTLVNDPAWTATWMLTVRLAMLPGTEWSLEHNQRVHVHLATAEALARVALLEEAPLGPGEAGWVQLRLESPLLARGGDRVVVRSYSPVTTIGGGVVAEPLPPKRRHLDAAVRRALERVVDGDADESVAACAEVAGWSGVARAELPMRTGRVPGEVERAVAAHAPHRLRSAGPLLFAGSVIDQAGSLIADAVARAHRADPLLEAIPRAAARAGLPPWAPAELAEAALARLVEEGTLETVDGAVRLAGHDARPTAEQADAAERIMALLGEAGLAPPTLEEFPDGLRTRPDLRPLVRRLEQAGSVRQVAEDLYVDTRSLEAAEASIRRELGGRSGLGPADFRSVLPVTRKHLIPLLNHFDGRGVTVRSGEGRDVPAG